MIFAGCTACKENHPEDCHDKVMLELGMTRYNGEAIACRTFLKLYKFEGEDYFLLDNFCADMVNYPFDCEGNEICGIGKEPVCQKFSNEAVEIGIIGIRKN